MTKNDVKKKMKQEEEKLWPKLQKAMEKAMKKEEKKKLPRLQSLIKAHAKKLVRKEAKKVKAKIKAKMPAKTLDKNKKTSVGKEAVASKMSKAHELRRKARLSLRKAGKPVPKMLQKGSLNSLVSQASNPAPKAGSQTKKKTKQLELARAAQEKLSRAHKLRVKARLELVKNGKPIPAALKKGGMEK